MGGPPTKRYLTKANPCRIICNTFKGQKNLELKSYEMDKTSLASTFEWLNFDVETYDELASNDMMDKINELAKEDYSELECFVLIIMSHGGDGGRIQGTDNKFVEINKIIEKFVTAKSLNGIPKLFFIQTCRGDEWMKTVSVAEEMEISTADCGKVLKAQKADVFTFYSTTQGRCFIFVSIE